MILEKVPARLLSRIGQFKLSARAIHREIREKYHDRVLGK
jgi:hypothetical protein